MRRRSVVRLDEAKPAALTDAAMRCSYVYSGPEGYDPFSEENLPYSEPDFTSVEPFQYQLAFAAEDTALSGHLVVLDCVSGEPSEAQRIPYNEVSALRDRYTVTGNAAAADLLEWLEALSPTPHHTELAGQMSPAMEQALEDAEMATFESYVQALSLQPTMYRYEYEQKEDQWIPANPDQGYTYGDVWNLIPGAELEETFLRRFGMDLTANDRALLNNTDFVPVENYLGGPVARYDGNNYIVYLRGVGNPMPFSYETSLVCHYDGTYTAVFSFIPDE